MTAERWERLSPHIDAALDLDAPERSAYLERVCAHEPSLRDDLERLLGETERGDSLIDRAATERFALLLDDGPDQLPEVLEDRFVVEREIGRGGMATVFLAHDRKHDRPVAIKVLRRELAASVGPERFLREIRTAARLQHPHVVSLHDSGEAGGFLYYIMPYMQGESLRQRLDRERQLSRNEALRIIREVADALDHAHSRGVVHRDIKPENIYLSGGHALVMDFGIAHALAESAGNGRITSGGLAIGTPAYMSPEQAAAQASVDGRADVYSLACVLYEMLTGHVPFMGTTSREILARHSIDPVPRLRASRPDLPLAIEAAVTKALSKAPSDRYAAAGAFAEACRQLSAGHSKTWRRLAGLAAPGVVATAALFTISNGRESTRLPVVVERAASPSVAILAFKSIGGDKADEALSDGISEEIAVTIGRIPGLNVKAPRSSFSLRNRNLTVQEIGRALEVRYLVDGSVQREAENLRIRVVLLAAFNDSVLWRQEYSRPLGEVFRTQDEIARAIASELSVKLAPGAVGSLARRSTRSAEAHELYLRGRYFFQRRDSVSMRKAREYFEGAIAVDSTFALAYTGLSDTYSHGSVFGYALPHRNMPKAKEYIDVALGLDSMLVEAHSSRAFIATFYDWDWPTAGRHFQRAMELDPGHASAYLWRGWYLIATDSMARAIQSAEQALALEPFMPLTNTRLVSFLYYGRRYDDAVQQARKAFELDSTFFQIAIERARALGERGRCDEAMAVLERAPIQTAAVLQGIRGYTYGICGRRRQAVAEAKYLRDQARMGVYVSHYSLAVIEAALGNEDAAIAELNSAFVERAWPMFLIDKDPAFDGLRDDARFRRLVRRVGVHPSRAL